MSILAKESLFNSLKNIGIVLGTLVAMYSVAWTLGVAPITNSKAESMINSAVQQQSDEIKQKIEKLEDRIEKWNEDAQATKTQVGRIDERTLITNSLQNQILQELRQIKRGIQ